MPHARGLLLVVIALIVAAVGGVYYLQKKSQVEQAPQPPSPLPIQLNAAAKDWCVTKTDGDRRIVEICAKNFRQIKDPARMELEGVELHLYRNPPTEYDQVRSARAVFDNAAGTLYSEGDVAITRGVPAQGEPRGRLMVIRSSGVTFDSKAGRATTERAASFEFDQGNGRSVGATYDPSTRELRMHRQVALHWRGRSAKARPMKLEAGELIYKEKESKVYLLSRATLTREAMVLEAGGGVVTLEEGVIRLVEAREARGTDRDPRRKLEYSAENLVMHFNADGKIERLRGDKKARLVSTAEDARTTVTADRVDLEFDTSGEDSTLRRVVTTGHSVVHSDPVPRKNVEPPQPRVLRSNVVELRMRPGGPEIEEVQTHSPAQIEFLAARAGQRYRRMDGERLWITYGARNRVESFRSVNVATFTEAERKPGRKDAAPSRTWSKDLSAGFDPKTGDMAVLRQWGQFRYEEGPRKAQAHDATLEQASGRITLTGGARVWDPSGSAAADQIVLDQNSGDFTAEGGVSSTRAPDRKGSSSAMLSQEEPLQAKADRMSSTGGGAHLDFEGHAVLWQGGNRLRADRIEIDREKERLQAHGNVINELLDKSKAAAAAKKKSAPVYTVVRAAELLYEEENRLAHYRGAVLLRRMGTEVRAQELRAYLNDSDEDSSLEKALADGAVEIVQTTSGRTRKGIGEHAEYYVSDERVILHGGQPMLADSVKGTTRGGRLTYFANNDRLLVDGQEQQPAVSRIRRK